MRGRLLIFGTIPDMATLKLSKTVVAPTTAKGRSKPDDVPSASLGRRARAGLLTKKKLAAAAPEPGGKKADAKKSAPPRERVRGEGRTPAERQRTGASSNTSASASPRSRDTSSGRPRDASPDRPRSP